MRETKYKPKTRKVVLKKDWFEFDLFWTTKNNTKLDVNNIVVVYMDRATQINTDKLCELFGYERVFNIVDRYIKNYHNRKEAIRQLEYNQHKNFGTRFELTNEEINSDYYNNPKQRVVDYYCNQYGVDGFKKQLDKTNLNNIQSLRLRKILAYYEMESEIKRIKNVL